MKHAADMSDLGHSYSTKEFLELIAEVQQYLYPEESAFKDDLPHRSYLKRFMTRCPELTVRKRKVRTPVSCVMTGGLRADWAVWYRTRECMLRPGGVDWRVLSCVLDTSGTVGDAMLTFPVKLTQPVSD